MRNISKKIIVIMLVVMVAIACLTINSNAATINASLSSNDKLVAGSTVTVSINVNQPVYGISAKLSYDTNVFESATLVSTVATSADLSNNVIVIESGSAMSAGTIGTITLKVKENITATEAKVSLSNGKATDEAVTTQTLNNPSVTIKANAAAESGSQPGTTNTESSNVGTTNTNTQKKITTSKSKTKIPAAGDATTIAITSTVAVIAVVGIVGFVKYAKNKDIK